MTFQTRALDLAQSFQLRTRDDGSTFYVLPDSAPPWMHECIRDCHHEEMPNDWRYSMVRQLAFAIAEYDSADAIRDAALDVANDAAEIYTGPLLSWYADRPGRMDYAEQWIADTGVDSVDGGILGHLMAGQTYCIEQILHCVVDACEARDCELVEA